jgi:hypothetical protein
MRVLALFLLLLSSPWALGEWQLLPDYSRVSFVSFKRGEMAELQRFKELSGHIDDQGLVRVVLPFAGLDTGLALRDMRTREELFESERFPQAEVIGEVDVATWEQLAVGAAQVETLEIQLDLHGRQQRLKAEILVSRLGEESVQVTTLEPLLLKAADFDLLDGLERLRTYIGGAPIGPEVPVFAVLSFQRRP